MVRIVAKFGTNAREGVIEVFSMKALVETIVSDSEKGTNSLEKMLLSF